MKLETIKLGWLYIQIGVIINPYYYAIQCEIKPICTITKSKYFKQVYLNLSNYVLIHNRFGGLFEVTVSIFGITFCLDKSLGYRREL